MSRRGSLRLWIALVACLATVSPARAASPADEARRLDDLLFFVRELDRGWDPLLREVRRSIEAQGERPRDEIAPVLSVRDEAAWLRAEALFATGDAAHEERCADLYRWLVADALDPARRASSTRRLADLLIRRGERLETAGDEDGALAAYLEAVDNAPEYAAGYEKVAALGLRQAGRRRAAQDFDGALQTLVDVLERIERGLPSGHASVAQARGERDSILATTGVLSVRYLGDSARLERVRGAKADFRTASIALVPAAGGATPPVLSAARPTRVLAGPYRARLAAGGTQIEADVVVRADGGSVTVPAIVPAGMVWVAAAGGGRSFLCDRTEVSNAAYEEFAQTSGARSVGGPPNAAAAGVPFADAQRYAAWAGKELPTGAQWTQAAFGAPGATSPRYPWGDQPGTPGTHFFAGRSEPGPVDGCPAGASRAGVLNLAGNVFEWLADGWFIGGGYVADVFGGVVGYRNPVDGSPTWDADFLRNKVPTIAVFRDLPPDLKNKHHVYRVTEDDAETFLRQVGLRCVVPLESTP